MWCLPLLAPRCKNNVVGRQCDRCAPGFYGYPNCRSCDCNEAGTEEEVCDSFTGQCLCKVGGPSRTSTCAHTCTHIPHPALTTVRCPLQENVQGSRCDQCRVGTFHLDPTNPKGCTSCFCFGATDRCRSSDKRRTEVMWRSPVFTYRSGLHSLPSSSFCSSL